MFKPIADALTPETTYTDEAQSYVGALNYWRIPDHLDLYLKGAYDLPLLDNLRDYDE